MLNYVLAQDSTDGSQNSMFYPGDISGIGTRGASFGYTIRQLPPVDYSYAVLRKALTATDELSFKRNFIYRVHLRKDPSG